MFSLGFFGPILSDADIGFHIKTSGSSFRIMYDFCRLEKCEVFYKLASRANDKYLIKMMKCFNQHLLAPFT